MFKFQSSPDKLVKKVTLAALAVMLCWGLFLVLVQIKPFAIDEWRIIYNLKFRNASALLGPLEFVQQFPRVYLEVIKAFTSVFDYSYFSLRLPSFLVGTATMALAWKLMNRIFGKEQPGRYLLVLIIIASPAFFVHYVEMKQYTMDILLSLVGIWQLLQLQDISKGTPFSVRKYLLLCLSFVAAPFFSYTYPIVITPLFFIVFMYSIRSIRIQKEGLGIVLFRIWLPLIFSAISIVAFYHFDAARLLKDNKMHLYWQYLMMPDSFDPLLFCKAFYNLFALAGSGLFFEVLIGTLGMMAFFYSIKECAGSLKKPSWDTEEFISWYSVCLIIIVMVLFTAGKLAIGERRLNIYLLPVAGILIVTFINRLQQIPALRKITGAVMTIIITGAVGNVVSAPVNEMMEKRHNTMLRIYVNTENAIVEARLKKIPVFITPAIACPFEKRINYPGTNIAANELCIPGYTERGDENPGPDILGDWVLKTFPAFIPDGRIAVYAIRDMGELTNSMKQLPPDIKAVMAGDGVTYKIVERKD